MTLTITIVTPRVAYQCADYRLQDAQTARLVDFETQKTTLVNRQGWTALVAFAGVGRAEGVDVSDWLADKIDELSFDAPLDALIEALLSADREWLGSVRDPILRRHTFSVAAFVGSSPVFGVVSNFEEPSGRVENAARPNLTAWVNPSRKPVVLVSGQRQEVPRPERRRLRALAERDPDPQVVYEALSEVNRAVAKRNDLVSEACWVVHARLTGDAGGRGFGLEGRPFVPRMAIPAGAEDIIRKLVADQFGEGRGAITGITTMRAEATEEYHQTQLKEKPNDASVRSNYGAFLADRGQTDEAEKQYRIALELQPNHVNALGNMANLQSDRERLDQAQELYERALAVDPGSENVSWNYSRFLVRRGDVVKALEVAEAGSTKNQQSGRLHLLAGNLRLMNADANGALSKVEEARSNRADQAQVETLNAFASHLSGAPTGDCIAAYEVALSVNPDEPNLHLNLSQLLFIRGDAERARRELPAPDVLGDDGKLERLFYELAHTRADPRLVASTMRSLLARGARTAWDFGPNIDRVGSEDVDRARLLRSVADALAGAPSRVLDGLIDGSLTLD